MADSFGEQFLIVPTFIPDAATTTPDQRLHDRASLYFPMVAGTVIGLIWAAFVLLRRSDLAIYRMYGVTRVQLLIMSLIEAGFIIVVPASMAFVSALAVLASTQGNWLVFTSSAYAFAAQIAVVATFVPVTVYISGSKRPIDLLKER